MILKKRLQQLFCKSSTKQQENLPVQEKALDEYERYKNEFGKTIADAELIYYIATELFENWRAGYREEGNPSRYDAAWRYVDNKDFVDLLKKDDLPNWVRKKDTSMDGIFVPDDALFVDIVSLNYDELEAYRPDLHHNYKMTGKGIASMVMYNQQAEVKLTEEQIGEEIFKTDAERKLIISNQSQKSFKDLPKYKQLDYLKKYYLGEAVAEKLQEQEKEAKVLRQANSHVLKTLSF